MHYDKILVTTDLTEDSKRAFDTAAYLAKMDSAEINLLHISEKWQPPVYMLHEIPNPESIVRYNEAIIEDAENKLKEYATKYFHGQSLVLKVIQTEKSVWEEVCNYAKEIKANIVLMSSHGKSRIGQIFMGSVVSQVVANAPCPVLVVPPKK